MTRGLYTAASGMLANLHRQVALANALANVNTPGYKADRFTTRSFPQVLLQASGGGLRNGLGQLGSGVVLDMQGPDLSPGTIAQTDATLDVAVDGEGFFVVRDAEANLRLTRDGHFLADDGGVLVTSEGFQVLDTNGQPITVQSGDVEITRDGRVFAAGEPIATIRLASAPTDGLLRAGNSSFVVEAGTELADADGQLIQGSLEGSNVQTTALMTQMMNVSRAYESAQRIFSMQNQILGETVRDVGRF